jgi:hypothetical protein
VKHPLIPDAVRRLIAARIPSVPHLEALVLAHGAPGKAWTPMELADLLYVSRKAAASLIDDLVEARMLHSSGAGATYAPSDELRLTVDQLVELYAQHVVQISHLIHARDSGAAQRLADAFRLPRRRP